MSSKKEKKGTIINKRGSEYTLDGSDYYEDSDEGEAGSRRMKYNSSIISKTANTPRKGRDLERTRSRQSKKTSFKSPVISDEEEEDEETLHEGEVDCCKERIKIGRNLIRSKYKAQVGDFKEKVQKILKEVYTFHYNSGKNYKSTVNQEKEIKVLTAQINERIINSKEYLMLFARILQENISIYIRSFKDLIVEKFVNKKLKERYYELKKGIHFELNKDKNISKKEKDAKVVKCIAEVLEFCKENKLEMVGIVNDLNKIYNILIKACPQLNDIFSVPLGELEANYEVCISMENLHREEFLNVIINDEFIKSLINEINNKDIPNFLEMRPTIAKIEEEIRQASNDMKKLKELIDKIDNKQEDFSRLNTAESVHDYLITKSKNIPRLGPCINVNCKCPSSTKVPSEAGMASYIDPFKLDLTNGNNNGNTTNTTTTNTNSTMPPNISKVKLNTSTSSPDVNATTHKNIDELYEYIIADDKKKPDKNTNKKGKNNKKNKMNALTTNVSAVTVATSVNLVEIEKEIEEFKTKIKTDSIHASCIRKVRPKLTKEWVQLITKTSI